ncbi:MAG: thiamine pyrophosphate-binding protein [Rhodobacterales bacterium]|nr:thiamine pyrophosphate-binding protein [Rhodobacterales bacterium]
MNVAEVLTRYLMAAGIDRVYGYPGDPNIEFLESLRRAGLDFVLARREGTAALMAQAYGMVTGRPGVCLSTLGPGSSNLVNGVAAAFLDRVPMLALSGQIATAKEPLFTHQVLDHARMFSPVAKWTASIVPGAAGGILRRALRTAMADRPGPVHLTIAADVIGAAVPDQDVVLPPLEAAPGAAAVFARPGADPDVARRLDGARRPLLLAGLSAVRGAAGPALTRLAERIGAAGVVAHMAKGRVAQDHPCYAGTLDMACNGFLWDFVKSADLVVAVGFDAVELIKPWTVTAPTIHIDSLANTDQIYAAEVEVVGAIAPTLDGLAETCREAEKWPAADLTRHRAELNERMRRGRVAGRLNPTDVVDAVRAARPRETVVTTDVGSHKILVGQGWTTHAPRAFLTSNGLSTMGFSLPAGIAARQVLGDTPVVSFMGDGGFAMVQGELRLASALGLGLTVVVFCDGSLNRIELKQMVRQYESTGTRIEDTDVVKLAEAMACDGVRVETENGLMDALGQQRPDRPLVIGAAIDPGQYLAQF